MLAFSKEMPVITQYDKETLAVPISIRQVEQPVDGKTELLYQYEQILVPCAEVAGAVKALDRTKASLVAAVKIRHQQVVSEGLATSFGFRVDIQQENITDWSAALLLMQMTKAPGISIGDYHNKTHALTGEEYGMLCGEIGQYLSQLRSYKWSMRSAILAASSAEEAYGAAQWDFPT